MVLKMLAIHFNMMHLNRGRPDGPAPAPARIRTRRRTFHPSWRRTSHPSHGCLHSDDISAGANRVISSSSTETRQLKVIVIGANPAGLAAAVGLAEQAGCAVQVHDSRTDPRRDKHAACISSLAGLGKHGLGAVERLSLGPWSGRELDSSGVTTTPAATITQPTSSRSAASGYSSTAAGSIIDDVCDPNSADITAVQGHLPTSIAPVDDRKQGPGVAALSHEPLPGLILLNEMVVEGPGGQYREQYSGTASRSSHPARLASALAGKTAGIVAIDELSLTTLLLTAAARHTTALTAHLAGTSPPLGLSLPPSDSTAAADTDLKDPNHEPRKPQAAAPLKVESQGSAASPGFKAAQGDAAASDKQAGSVPAAVREVSADAHGSLKQGDQVTQTTRGSPVKRQHWQAGSVDVHHNSRLTLLDTSSKAATFIAADGRASVVPFDLCIAADAEGGGHLVASALHELHTRQAAHQHTKADSKTAATADQQGETHMKAQRLTHGESSHDVTDMEYKGWYHMPHAPLAEVTQDTRATTGGAASSHSARGLPEGWSGLRQGQLIVWTTPGPRHTTFTAPQGTGSGGAAAAAAATTPGGHPHTSWCFVVAWPSRDGISWSGCVFTHPQVFETLRSQMDYQSLLLPLTASSGSTDCLMGSSHHAGGRVTGGLPAEWVDGIACQLRQNPCVGRVPAGVSPSPTSLCAPAAGLVCLSTAAVPCHSPQLLNPGVSWALAEAVALADAVTSRMTSCNGTNHAGAGAGTGGGGAAAAVQTALKTWDAQHLGEAQALHRLTLQLSWLRHPFSPAAAAAAASVPVGTVAWLLARTGAARLGLTLQWRALAAVLPLAAAVQRVLLYKLGLAQQDKPHQGSPKLPDASYRQPPAADCSTSLDSGVHIEAPDQRRSGSGSARPFVGPDVVVQYAQATGNSPSISSAQPAMKRDQDPHTPGSAESYSLSDVLEGIEPCGSSLVAFLHTSGVRPSGVWWLLQVAPLVLSVLWGAILWVMMQAVRWGVWAFKACCWTYAGAT